MIVSRVGRELHAKATQAVSHCPPVGSHVRIVGRFGEMAHWKSLKAAAQELSLEAGTGDWIYRTGFVLPHNNVSLNLE